MAGETPAPRPPVLGDAVAGAPKVRLGSSANKAQGYKHIALEPEIYQQLVALKYRYGFRSFSELMRYLLDVEARSRASSEMEARIETIVKEFCSARPGARFYLAALVKAGLVKDAALKDYITKHNREVICPE